VCCLCAVLLTRRCASCTIGRRGATAVALAVTRAQPPVASTALREPGRDDGAAGEPGACRPRGAELVAELMDGDHDLPS
jgi:hypothetical protein